MSDELLIKNGLIVTGDKRGKIIPNGFIRINDGKIAEINEGEPSFTSENVIDASGGVIIPGFITAHTHLYGILLRGASLNIKPPTDFAQVLQRVWWPVDEALTIEDAYASALSAGADMLRNGSTLFADTYSGPNSIEGSLNAIAKATKELGIRGIIAFEMTERNNPDEASRGFKEGVDFINSCGEGDLVSGMVSIHSSFTVGDYIITRAAEQAK